MGDVKYQLLTRYNPVALAVALAWGWLVPAAQAQMPTGGQVVVPGSATINASDPKNYVVTQTSGKAIINWQGFSIGAGNSVRFVQPGRDAVVLNRVVGNDASNIFGSISANGQVFLVNPNGIYFAPGATLDVGGLVATTLGIRDRDFLAGNYVFTRGDSAARAEVINAGVLRARDNGYVVLAGDYAANRGVVEARLGTVMLGSASKMTLDIDGDSLVNYALNERNLTELAGVANSGELLADGGRVVMTAMTARSLTGAVVNNTGVIQARGVEEKAGAVYLLADDAGIALGSGSKIDVSGVKGGGTVLVGGNYQGGGSEVHASTVSMAADASIKADATQSGDGGKVVLWSDGVTDFKGTISARGGSQGGDGGNVEVSGKQLAYAGSTDTLAPQGKTGTLLLDPTNITIANNSGTDTNISCTGGTCSDASNAGGSILSIATLESQLGSSNVIVTTTSTKSDAGNITLQDALKWSSGNMLTLQAANSILINNTITATSDGTSSGTRNGTLVLNAGNGVTQSSAILVSKLGLQGSGTFTLNNSGNAVDTLAASVNGAVNFRTSGALSVGSVDGVNGVSLSGKAFALTVGGALSQSQALNVGSLELNSSTGTVDLSNASNSIGSVAAQTHGDFTLKNSSANLYIQTVGSTTGINTDNHNFTLVNTNTLWLGNGSSNGTVDVGSGTIDLTTNRALQYGSAPLKADKLVVRTTNYAGLSGVANSVNTLAVSATGAGGGSSSQSFDFLNDKSIAIGTVGGVSGITTQNSHAKVQAYGNITLADDVNTGTGHFGMFAQNGGSYYNIDTAGHTITAGALAAAGNDVNLDRDGNGINNATGKINTKVIAIRSGGGFAYTAPNDLTISSNVWGLSGITAANGNVYIKTGAFSGYSLATDYSDYYDSTTGKYKAGLILDGGISAKNHTIYLDSASGVFQWASDNSASPPTKRSQAKLEATRLMLTGEGQFSLLLADNAISQFASSTKGSVLLADSIPLTIDEYGFSSFGVSKTLTGVQTSADLISGSVAGGDAQYNAHNILIASSDDPNSGSNLAMDIRKDIVASTLGSGTVNLSVGASDNHKDALVRTSNGAYIRGSVMVLGGAEDRGTFDIDSNVASMSAAGGRSMLVDNTAYTGTLNVLGLGSSQGGGAPTPVGNVFLSTGGAMTLLGGKSTGNYLQLRANKLDVLGTMEMKDGARVLLQPLDMSYDIGVNHASNVDINYSTGLLQRFSQTAAIYVGSTPALMNQDSAVPGVVRNLVSTGKIRIGSNLQLGYRSLSAETSSQILANYIGDVYNLRLVAPSVSIQGFNVTGTQVHIFADNLSMNSAASYYKLASNTEVTLRGYRNRTVWVGYRGNSQEAGFTEDLLKKFPDGTHIIISGSTDQPLVDTGEAICSGCVDIHLAKNGQFSLGNRTLTLSTAEDVYGYESNGNQVWFRDNPLLGTYTAASWNAANNPKLVKVQSALINADGTQGKAGGTWGGCPDYNACQASNPSTPTGPGGNPVTPITPGGNGNNGGGDNGGGNNTPPPPPADPPDDPTNTTTNNAANTGNNNGNNGSGNDNNGGNNGSSSGFDGNDDPNGGMSDGGPSGPGDGFDPGSGTTGGDSGTGTSGGDNGTGTGNDGISGGNGNDGSGTGTGANDGGFDGSGAGNGSGDGSGAGDGNGANGNGNGSGNDGSGADGSGNGNGNGSGAGDGSGNGSGSGSDSGDGSGSGSGNGAGNGDGSGSGNGSGDGSGSGADNGNGNGSGSGSGADDGSGGSGRGTDDGSGGSGSGTDNGDGNGSGRDKGSGQGAGSDNGNGSGGDGSGAGDGSGSKSGDGADDGSGQGAGSGKQAGSGSGEDDGEGSGKSGRAQGDDAGGSGRSGDDDGKNGSDGGEQAGGGSGKQSGSSDGSGSKGGDESGKDGSAGGKPQETVCLGQQGSRQRSNKELPEQGGPLSGKPLVQVRNGGVNLDSDCSKQQQGQGGSRAKQRGR